MGELLHFPMSRVRATAIAPTPPSFCFDVGDPFSYLAAERVERTLGEVEWVAVDRGALAPGADRLRGRALAQLRASAHARAAALRLPLVWPERFPSATPGALRAADLACEIGCGPAFTLALCRLAFCGGFDLDDPEVLAEAAAAARVPLGACLEAAGETARDVPLRERGARLRHAGVVTLPAFAVDGVWLSGEAGLAAAVDAVHRDGDTGGDRGGGHARRPLAPVG